jgi:hypothetical protein
MDVNDGKTKTGRKKRTNTFGRFVAPMTVTPVSSSTPSISLSKLISMPVCDPLLPASDRAAASASISSCKNGYQKHVEHNLR